MNQPLDITSRVQTGATVQHRSFEFTEFEFRDEGTDGVVFEGVASVVNTPYSVRDRYGEFMETIREGAFNKTLKDSKADVALFINHDYTSLPLANRNTKSGFGSLQLAADPHLRVVATLNPARPSVVEAKHAVADGQARQMSIGFTVPNDPKKDVWNDDLTERMIHELKLGETSIVWRGASPTTTGKMRSVEDLLTVDMSEWSDAEIRRAIAHLETRLTPEEEAADKALAEQVNEFAERDRKDRERLDRLRLVRP